MHTERRNGERDQSRSSPPARAKGARNRVLGIEWMDALAPPIRALLKGASVLGEWRGTTRPPGGVVLAFANTLGDFESSITHVREAGSSWHYHWHPTAC